MNLNNKLKLFYNDVITDEPRRRIVRQLRNEISDWKEFRDDLSDFEVNPREYFHVYYFDTNSDKIKKIKEIVHDQKFMIKMSGLSNENAIKLFHKSHMDHRRMKLKLKELNIKTYEVNTITHLNNLNKHGNYRDVYYKNQEIVY